VPDRRADDDVLVNEDVGSVTFIKRRCASSIDLAKAAPLAIAVHRPMLIGQIVVRNIVVRFVNRQAPGYE
jgi:hypothetical protein